MIKKLLNFLFGDKYVEYGDKGFKKHSTNCYTIKNQNGFNNSLYDYFNAGSVNSYSKLEVRKLVGDQFPPHYPVTMTIIDQTFECNRIYLEYFDF